MNNKTFSKEAIKMADSIVQKQFIIEFPSAKTSYKNYHDSNVIKPINHAIVTIKTAIEVLKSLPVNSFYKLENTYTEALQYLESKL